MLQLEYDLTGIRKWARFKLSNLPGSDSPLGGGGGYLPLGKIISDDFPSSFFVAMRVRCKFSCEFSQGFNDNILEVGCCPASLSAMGRHWSQKIRKMIPYYRIA